MPIPQKSIALARYDFHLQKIAKQGGLDGVASGPVEAMREALACVVGGFEYALPFAGRQNHLWWLLWKPEQGTSADFFGKTSYSRKVETVQVKSLEGDAVDAYEPQVAVKATYAELVEGYRLLETFREGHAKEALREIILGYVLRHQQPERDAEALYNLVTLPGNEKPLDD